MDIRTELPRLLPKAIAWVEAQAAWVANSGRTLDNSEVQLARRLGVAQPERVRVALVEALPLPTDPELRAVAIQTGLLGPEVECSHPPDRACGTGPRELQAGAVRHGGVC